MSLVMAGCSGGGSAHDLAQRACDLAKPNNTPIAASDASATGHTVSDLRSLAGDYQEATSLASKAAAADRTYEWLAEAINSMEGIWSAVVEIYEEGGMDPTTWTVDQQNHATAVSTGWDDAAGTAYAQCEIVTVE